MNNHLSYLQKQSCSANYNSISTSQPAQVLNNSKFEQVMSLKVLVLQRFRRQNL